MADIRTSYDAGASRPFDYAADPPGLAEDAGLKTAVLLSLFTDRRAGPDEVPPDGTDDRRGWWADAFTADGDVLGSRLWLLARAKNVPNVLVLARSYAEEALAWLVEDGVAASVAASAAAVPLAGGASALALTVDIERPDQPAVQYRFQRTWEALA
jgi:phage gp46-like protein